MKTKSSSPALVTFDDDDEGSDKKSNFIMVQSYMPEGNRKLDQSLGEPVHISPVKEEEFDDSEIGLG